MVDVTAGQGSGATGGGFPSLSEIGAMVKRGDIALALGILTILVVLILPLPSFVLDLFLAISITLSILILMTSLFIQTPLEFSSFPTTLLISTMLRLSLNLASTRLILSHGHEGTDAAGHVIEAFGNFVMGGNFVIGIIVFAILVTVNFVVITKGSGRIAEVAARFHLDADARQADGDRRRPQCRPDRRKGRARTPQGRWRTKAASSAPWTVPRNSSAATPSPGFLSSSSTSSAASSSASRSRASPSAKPRSTYTVLTVGDGLVTQIPALIVSTAAGLLVSKAGVSGAADKALIKQFSGYPQALGMAAAVMIVLALLPGIPTIPFMALGGGAAVMAWKARKFKHAKAAEEAKAAAPRPRPRQQPRRPRKSRSRPRSRSTISRSSWAMRCYRWSTAPTARTG